MKGIQYVDEGRVYAYFIQRQKEANASTRETCIE